MPADRDPLRVLEHAVRNGDRRLAHRIAGTLFPGARRTLLRLLHLLRI